ncbi:MULTISPECIES: aspartyl-phosphate phosphatase Spo0E family protein [Bacillaceae]|nr:MULTISPECIES: aspartyl-phosphate phosphatase Spo0E family protein [Bacillaceae]MBY6024531.1 aspartyl-phosphate phosphatase Spo0E family protein [Nitratireductor sp. DP7N14-4]MDT2048639.1 aspartyl-phosphate phosphatase Spo0E family protein [Priestia flexa]TDB48042.1 aspartyl-phosphate phosphatase Spo0E family protein [Bacillus sp. CBEL-1]
MEKNLLERIEEHRHMMLSTAQQTSLCSKEVLRLSSELDTLLNQYTKQSN